MPEVLEAGNKVADRMVEIIEKSKRFKASRTEPAYAGGMFTIGVNYEYSARKVDDITGTETFVINGLETTGRLTAKVPSDIMLTTKSPEGDSYILKNMELLKTDKQILFQKHNTIDYYLISIEKRKEGQECARRPVYEIDIDRAIYSEELNSFWFSIAELMDELVSREADGLPADADKMVKEYISGQYKYMQSKGMLDIDKKIKELEAQTVL